VNINPVRIAVPGMEYPYPASKYLLDSLDNLGGECNLRQQVKHLFALVQHLPDQMDVDLRFPTGSNPMQQYSLVGQKLFFDIIICLLLLLIQWICPDRRVLFMSILPKLFLLKLLQHPFLKQGRHGTGIASFPDNFPLLQCGFQILISGTGLR